MTWTAPRTFVTAEVITAAILNTHIRDNLLETSAATVTTAGDLAYADAANSMGSRLAIGAAGSLMASTGTAPVWRTPSMDVDTGFASDNATSYFTLGDAAAWNFASEVQVTVTTGTTALVLLYASVSNGTAGNHVVMSYSVTGASALPANDNWSCGYESSANDDVSSISTFHIPTLTAGSNTFTLAARNTGGTGTINDPRIGVIPL